MEYFTLFIGAGLITASFGIPAHDFLRYLDRKFRTVTGNRHQERIADLV